MLHTVYSLCYRLLLPFALAYLWWSTRRNGASSEGWQQRLGWVPALSEPVIWVHAVSVGETIAAAPLVKALLARRPDVPILVTAMTATGAAQARTLFGDQVHYAYAPFDTPGSVRRFLRRVRPRALVIMETEIWPNMITGVSGRQCPIFLINGRLSAKSARGYQRFGEWTRGLVRRIDWIAAQADEDAGRFREIGARGEVISVTGSVKFDVNITDAVREQSQELREEFQDRPVWIAASTHEGEDEQLLEAHARVREAFADAVLIIVPRHPQRFDSVANMISQRGFSLARRSAGEPPAAGAPVYLGDTMGELMVMFGAADVAFVGGSLIERGGHNPLEPAAWGMPVITGPHVFNFETVYRQLEEHHGLVRVSDSAGLGEAVARLFSDPDEASRLGTAALETVEANRGALNQVVEGVLARLAPEGGNTAAGGQA